MIVHSQKPDNYNFHPPLDIPLYLSGNFAELRSDHFHSGIDIKTQGRTGFKVYAIEEGYVSRIKVQSNGYGKSVYIAHPNGLTSQYGHLSAFSRKIDDIIKEYQYKHKSFKADIYLTKDKVKVSKGEVIALSGNSGSSAGPHLHFEIRNTANQYPQNVLEYGFPVKDDVSPKIFNLYMYEFSGKGHDLMVSNRNKLPLKFENNEYIVNDGEIIKASGNIGFSVEGYDYLNISRNRCGINSLEMYVNGELYFHFLTDEFGFHESRYINAFIDYDLKMEKKKKAQKLFLEPNTSLSMYKYIFNDGIIIPQHNDTLSIEIFLKDVNNNIANLAFKVTQLTNDQLLKKDSKEFQDIYKWYEPSGFSNHFLRLDIPANSLYENLKFTYSRQDIDNTIHPYVHNIASVNVPLHKTANLFLLLNKIDGLSDDKYGIVKMKKNKNDKSFVGGKVTGDWIKAGIREFGSYSVAADTLKPQIIPVNIKNKQLMKDQNSIRFIIRDDLSGIKEYKGLINNQWVLFEYDAKNDVIEYDIDWNRLQKAEIYDLEVSATDYCNNTRTFHQKIHF